MPALLHAPKAAYRWSVASRALAGIVGGYVLTSLIVLVLSLTLPWIGVLQTEAVLASTIGSFLVWVAIIMAVFHAWLWLVGAALPMGIIVWALLP